jgi:hypothetical protein
MKIVLACTGRVGLQSMELLLECEDNLLSMDLL